MAQVRRAVQGLLRRVLSETRGAGRKQTVPVLAGGGIPCADSRAALAPLKLLVRCLDDRRHSGLGLEDVAHSGPLPRRARLPLSGP